MRKKLDTKLEKIEEYLKFAVVTEEIPTEPLIRRRPS
jgi:hypothetical protein